MGGNGDGLQADPAGRALTRGSQNVADVGNLTVSSM